MTLRLLASITATTVAVGACAQEKAGDPLQPEPAVPTLTSEAIKQAVRESLAAEPKSRHEKPDERVLRSDQYTKFARAFSGAKIPSCLRPDALKHQPTSIEYKGWVIGVGGLPATPFWAYATLTGKCRIMPD